MIYKRIIYFLLPVLLPLMCGCSMMGWKVSVVSVAGKSLVSSAIYNQERNFAGALEFIRKGDEPAARDLLERVVDGPSRSGVTDEALFRLSILYLREDNIKGTVRALELLEHLKNGFPRSLWTNQAAPLVLYLSSVKTLHDKQRNVKTLKEHNLSLSRDNREMRQSIERLKALDIELEQKIKR